MIVYIGSSDAHAHEADLIRQVCVFEAISCFQLPKALYEQYHVDGPPVAVFRNDFIDVPSTREIVARGLYEAVRALEPYQRPKASCASPRHPRPARRA